MKYLSWAIIIFFCILGLAGFKIVGATSGACSYHGGVNCGIQGFYATCNDGTQSSVLYSDMDECSQSSNYCSFLNPDNYPSLYPYRNQSYCNGLMLQEMGQGGSFQSQEDEAGSAFEACVKGVPQYQAAQVAYQSCLTASQNSSSPSTTAQNLLNQLQQEKAQIISDCNSRVGNIWDTTNNTCVETNAFCQDVLGYGPNSRLQPNAASGTIPCTCAGGYQFNTQGSSCVVISAPVASIPTTTPAISSSVVSVPIAQSVTINSNLKIGSSGDDVITLQKFLEGKEFLTLPAGTTEGYFGSLTKKALIAFQTSAGLPATGYCGAMTRAAITGS